MYSLILLNGGVGKRVGAGQPKQFLKVNGIPILVYSLTAADAVPEINEIVMNFPEGWMGAVKDILKAYAIKTPVRLVDAGLTRHRSVASMIPLCSNEEVIIHEAARPFVTKSDFDALIDSPARNVSFMHEIPFTVAPVDPETHTIVGSLDRDRLRDVQLPQKFDKAALLKAHNHAAAAGVEYTEDATLVVESGFTVSYLDGRDENFKVTSPTDVRLATFLMQDSEVSYE